MVNIKKIEQISSSNIPILEVNELLDLNSKNNINIKMNNNAKKEELNLTLLQDTENYSIDLEGNITLKKLNPELEQKKEEFIEKCKEEGIEIKVSYTIRSEKKQEELYAIGRTKDQDGNDLSFDDVNKIKIIKAMLGKKKNAQETYEILNINKKDIIKVRDMLDENKSYDDISSKLNMNKNDIYMIDYLKNGGVTANEISNMTGVNSEDINKITNLILSSKDIESISNKINISKEKIIEIKCILIPNIMAALTNTDPLTAKKIINEINDANNNGEQLNVDELSKRLNVDKKTIEKIYYMEIKDTTKEDVANCFNKSSKIIDNIDESIKSNKDIKEIAQEVNMTENDIKIIKEMLDTTQQSDEVREIFNITEKDGIRKLISTVTNATGRDYSSNHQWGTAFDISIYDQNGNLVDDNNPNEELVAKVGKIGKSLDLEWGGDWKFEDTPHFELKDAEEIKEKYDSPKEYADSW